jgi:anaerobic nitric oxide reductase transcription regulator
MTDHPTLPPNQAPDLATLLPLALDMTASLSSEDRHRNLVQIVMRALPCDSVALLRLEGETLVPVASLGLSDDMEGRRFARSEHPRLDIICSTREVTRFPADSPLPDPYDGMVIGGQLTLEGHVHSCLGCSLWVEDELVGALTADAIAPGAFDHLQDIFLAHLAALAGASLRTSALIDALEHRAEQQGNIARDLVRNVLERRGGSLIGTSPVLQRLREEIDIVAPSDFPVLVTGETGVGKELVVRMLHTRSARAEQPLVYVNCAALPEAIVESELFGHERGAFTGADSERSGKFRVADGASLFLDEIGELPLGVQPKLLRVLQEGEIQRVGSDTPMHVDVRIFAATNRDLELEVAEGRFRADLLHRLDVCRILVPPLSDHPEDVAPLAGLFADRARSRLGCGPIRFAPAALDILRSGQWRGNVRELENVVSRAILRGTARTPAGERVLVEVDDLDRVASTVRTRDDLPPPPVLSSERVSLRESVLQHQRHLIRVTLDKHDGNWSATARELEIDRANLHHLAKRLGLK